MMIQKIFQVLSLNKLLSRPVRAVVSDKFK